MNIENELIIFGGKLKIEDLPEWIDKEFLLCFEKELLFVNHWLHLRSDIPSLDLEIVISNSTNIACFGKQFDYDKYLIIIPVGLILRIDYYIRNLERYALKENIHLSDPDLYGDLPEDLKNKHALWTPPEEMAFYVKEFDDIYKFWEALENEEERDQKLGRSEYRYMQIDELRLAILHCVFHEYAHFNRAHFAFQDKLKEIFDPAQRNQLHRGMEYDADIGAAFLLFLYRMDELGRVFMKSNDNNAYNDAIFESAWRISYTAAIVFSLYDSHRRSIHDYGRDTYHHPIIRLSVFNLSISMTFSKMVNTKDVNRFKEVNKYLVAIEGDGALAYQYRFNNWWLNLPSVIEQRNKDEKEWNLSIPHSIAFGIGPYFGYILAKKMSKAKRDWITFVEFMRLPFFILDAQVDTKTTEMLKNLTKIMADHLNMGDDFDKADVFNDED